MLVGGDKTKFVVHENIACRTSLFFRTAVRGDWKEATQKTVQLPEVKAEVFGTYLNWLYTGNVVISSDPNFTYNGERDESKTYIIFEHLVDAYGLGDFLQDRKFRNAVVDEVQEAVEEFGSLNDDALLFYSKGRVSMRSRLGKMIVDYYATDLDLLAFERDVETYPVEFVIEVAKVCVREQVMDLDERKPANRPKCYYHEHVDAEDACESTNTN